MGQTSIERLREYLAQLPPQAQALLMREFERAIERGEDAVVANFVLEELRKIVRGTDEEARPRTDDPARLLFRPLEPFLIEGNFPGRPGQIRRASLPPVWQWLIRDGAPDQARDFEAALDAARDTGTSAGARSRGPHIPARRGGRDRQARWPDGDSAALARVGRPTCSRICSRSARFCRPARRWMPSMAGFPAIPAGFRGFAGRLRQRRAQRSRPADDATIAVRDVAGDAAAVGAVADHPPRHQDRGLRRRNPRRRHALRRCRHHRAARSVLSRRGLRTDIRRGHFDNVAEHLKTLHDGVRGLRTELDLRNDSAWGKQLTSIRAEISNALQSEIDSVPGRVRRILRQRPDKDISTGAKVDSTEVEETAALIDFVAVCRTYASELAINEVTLRTYSDLQQYVEQSTEALVQSLRGGDTKTRAYRQMQVQAAIRFCDVLFGHDYASLMSRAAENAVTGERKPSRAG